MNTYGTRGDRRNAARAYAKRYGHKFRDVWPRFKVKPPLAKGNRRAVRSS